MLRELRPSEPEFATFVSALEAASLPTDDLFSAPTRYFALGDSAWGGIGGGADALLRSVVVAPSARGRGEGASIVRALAQRAAADGVQRLWLLTTSAAPFFERLGWRQVDRAAAPPPIATSRQFTGLCPASAALMVRAP